MSRAVLDAQAEPLRAAGPQAALCPGAQAAAQALRGHARGRARLCETHDTRWAPVGSDARCGCARCASRTSSGAASRTAPGVSLDSRMGQMGTVGISSIHSCASLLRRRGTEATLQSARNNKGAEEISGVVVAAAGSILVACLDAPWASKRLELGRQLRRTLDGSCGCAVFTSRTSSGALQPCRPQAALCPGAREVLRGLWAESNALRAAALDAEAGPLRVARPDKDC
jgi:hypothetical protein